MKATIMVVSILFIILDILICWSSCAMSGKWDKYEQQLRDQKEWEKEHITYE